MSLGLGLKIYLRGAIYSNMVALATDLLCGGVFLFVLYFIYLVSHGSALMFGFLEFICLFANLSAKYHTVNFYSVPSPSFPQT
jgi:hypothetical protein